nr:MAG TPA: hypothetical protein [Caudoviricetes sp.]
MLVELVLPSRRTFDAADAALGLVCFGLLFAIVFHLLVCFTLPYYILRNL